MDYKALVRAIFSQLKWYRKRHKILKCGGSTINMQLARTIFIPNEQSEIKRKIMELFIAKWLYQILSKEDLINIYIASVRYGHKIHGLSDALYKYFGLKNIENHKLTKAQSFFLVERLSSKTSNVNDVRVEHLLQVCKDLEIDKMEVKELYNNYKNLCK